MNKNILYLVIVFMLSFLGCKSTSYTKLPQNPKKYYSKRLKELKKQSRNCPGLPGEEKNKKEEYYRY